MAAHNERRHPAKRARSCAARNPRLRGCSPLRTPKRWSENAKAKKCRSAAFFLTPLRPLPSAPSGAKSFSTTRSVGADARCCGVAQRSMPQWGIDPHEWASSAGCRPSFWPTNGPAPADANLRVGRRGRRPRRPGQSCTAAKLHGRTLFAPTHPLNRRFCRGA